MYYTEIEKRKTPIGERPQWIKTQNNGVDIACDYNDRQGVVIDGETYYIRGRAEVDCVAMIDEPVWEETTKALYEDLLIMAQYFVDLEYKKILEEWGV